MDTKLTKLKTIKNNLHGEENKRIQNKTTNKKGK